MPGATARVVFNEIERGWREGVGGEGREEGGGDRHTALTAHNQLYSIMTGVLPHDTLKMFRVAELLRLK